MKVRFTVMIRKQSNSRRSGRSLNHQEQKRRGRSGVQQGACWLFFFYVNWIVHCEFVLPNTMVNSDFYCDVLRHLRENMCWKRLELWHNHNWLLHNDNAPDHMSLKTIEYVTDNNRVIVPHPPYPLDLAHCDFALIHKLKMKLKPEFQNFPS
jgi:hypothetical protein